LQLPHRDAQDRRRLPPVGAGVHEDVGHLDFIVFLEAAQAPGEQGLPGGLSPQMMGQDDFPLTEEDGVFHDLSQLPDIAPVFPAGENVHCLGTETSDLLAMAVICLAEEMVGKQGDVALPLPEGGDVDMGGLESVKEIQAEPALLTGPVEIHVGGGNDPDVHPDGLGPAQRREGLFLQNPEEFRLESGR